MSFNEWEIHRIGDLVISANTGLDAIKRAPIVEVDTGIKCLRIQDISQKKEFDNWGFCEVSKENFHKFQLKKDDLIIARTGETVGVNRLIRQDLISVLPSRVSRLVFFSKVFFTKPAPCNKPIWKTLRIRERFSPCNPIP